jgi:hypothetical protein
MPNWYSILEDNNGGFSMMRACLAIVVLAVMLNWSWVNYNKKEIVPIPDNAVTLIAALAGAKVIQRFGEKSGEISVDPDATSPSISTTSQMMGSGPLTVTVQGSLPVQGSIPLQQIQQIQQMQQPAPVAQPVAALAPVALAAPSPVIQPAPVIIPPVAQVPPPVIVMPTLPTNPQ